VFKYFCDYTDHIHIYVLLRPYTYTSLHISTALYQSIFTSFLAPYSCHFYTHVPMHAYILLRLYTCTSLHTSVPIQIYVFTYIYNTYLLCLFSYTTINALYNCTPIYSRYMFTCLYTHIRSIQIYKLLLLYTYVSLRPANTICLYMFTYFYTHICHPYTPYTNLQTATPIYLYWFTSFYQDIPIHVCIHVRPYSDTYLYTSAPIYIYMNIYSSTHLRPFTPYIHLRPYTPYSCLHTSTPIYLN
jgi:hypothetical protein